MKDQLEIPFPVDYCEAYNLEDKLKVADDMVIETLVHFDSTHKNIEKTLWKLIVLKRRRG